MSPRQASTLGCFALLAIQGCIVFPTRFDGHTDHGTHVAISRDIFATFEEGHTTRDDVLGRLGRRDVELAGGRLWIYSWESRLEFAWMVVVFDILGGGGAGAHESVHDFASMRYVILEFDGSDVLSRKAWKDGGRINGLATGMDDVMMKD